MLLFVRPTNGVYLPPKVMRLKGKSTVEEIDVVQEGHAELLRRGGHDRRRQGATARRKEIVVPPEKRVLNVEVLPSSTEYKPGEKAKVKVKLTDFDGKPFVGSTVLSDLRQVGRVHLRRLERAGDQGVLLEVAAAPPPADRDRACTHCFGNLLAPDETGMSDLGVFGDSVVEEMDASTVTRGRRAADSSGGGIARLAAAAAPAARRPRRLAADGRWRCAAAARGRGKAPSATADGRRRSKPTAATQAGGGGTGRRSPPSARTSPTPPTGTARSTTDKDGIAEVELDMPENLTAWKIKVWGMGHGTKVGQGEAEVVTRRT